LQPTARSRGVDRLAKRYKRDAERLQLVEQRDQVFQIATEPIKSPVGLIRFGGQVNYAV